MWSPKNHRFSFFWIPGLRFLLIYFLVLRKPHLQHLLECVVQEVSFRTSHIRNVCSLSVVVCQVTLTMPHPVHTLLGSESKFWSTGHHHTWSKQKWEMLSRWVYPLLPLTGPLKPPWGEDGLVCWRMRDCAEQRQAPDHSAYDVGMRPF